MGVKKLLKDEGIESSPNCCIIHLTFSKCQSLITNVVKIRADTQFKSCYICEPEHFHHLIISQPNSSSFSMLVKGSVPPLCFLSFESIIHSEILLFHVHPAFFFLRLLQTHQSSPPSLPRMTCPHLIFNGRL